MKSMWKAVITAVLLCSFFELGCGDAYRPIATPITQPGGDPASTDTVGVIQDAGTGQSGTLTQIDVSGDTNMAEKPIGKGATMGALDATNANIFVPNTDSDSVTSTTANTTVFVETTISLLSGSKPSYVTSTKSGVMYVANSGSNSDCPTSGSVGVIDATSLALIKNICVTGTPTFLVQTPNTTQLFALDSSGNTVTIIDTTSSAPNTTAVVGSNPIFATMSPDENYLYVLNQGSNDISVVNIASAAVVATLPVGGTGAHSMFYDKRLNRLYIPNTGSNTISVFDLTNSALPTVLIPPVTVGPAPVQVTALLDGSRVYVLNSGNATVTELSAANLAAPALKTITVNSATGATGTSITSSHDSTRVYVATLDPTNTSNGVAIIRTSDDTLVTTIASPQFDRACTGASCTRMSPTYVFTRVN